MTTGLKSPRFTVRRALYCSVAVAIAASLGATRFDQQAADVSDANERTLQEQIAVTRAELVEEFDTLTQLRRDTGRPDHSVQGMRLAFLQDRIARLEERKLDVEERLTTVEDEARAASLEGWAETLAERVSRLEADYQRISQVDPDLHVRQLELEQLERRFLELLERVP